MPDAVKSRRCQSLRKIYVLKMNFERERKRERGGGVREMERKRGRERCRERERERERERKKDMKDRLSDRNLKISVFTL